jgi:hypothetical protein
MVNPIALGVIALGILLLLFGIVSIVKRIKVAGIVLAVLGLGAMATPFCAGSLMRVVSMPQATLLDPPLTVIAQPDYALGRKAAELVVERFAQPDRPAGHLELSLESIVRASTGRPRDQLA